MATRQKMHSHIRQPHNLITDKSNYHYTLFLRVTLCILLLFMPHLGLLESGQMNWFSMMIELGGDSRTITDCQ